MLLPMDCEINVFFFYLLHRTKKKDSSIDKYYTLYFQVFGFLFRIYYFNHQEASQFVFTIIRGFVINV